MKKYKYNQLEEYSGINIEEYFEPKIRDDISIMNELEYFKLFINYEILELLSEESNNYMKKILLDKYGNDYKSIILKSNNYGTYPDSHEKREINKEDILAYIGIRIYMGLYKYSSIEEYWKDGLLHERILKK